MKNLQLDSFVRTLSISIDAVSHGAFLKKVSFDQYVMCEWGSEVLFVELAGVKIISVNNFLGADLHILK